MGRRMIAAGAALLLALLLAGRASAHAELERSAPQAGALLDAAPAELVMDFSEDLDPSFSSVQLYNSKNQVINPGPGLIDARAPKTMRLALGDLPKDSYTALWRVRSADDGHVTEGSVPFGVGVAATLTSLIPAPGTPDPATVPPPLLDAIARWLNLLVAMIAFGGLPFGLLVWRPAFRRWQLAEGERPSDDRSAADARITRFIRRMILLGVALFILTNALFLLSQAATAAGVTLIQALGGPAIQLLSGRSGLLLLARVGLALLIVGLAWRLPAAGAGASWPWWLALALVAGVVATFSLTAHAAAVGQGAALAVALDWLHIAASIAWLGGLLPLASAFRAARNAPRAPEALPLSILIPRFSWLSAACVVALAATGVYSYLLHIDALDLLPATTYGRALLIKLGLFGGLIVLGAINLLVLSPRLRSRGNRMAAFFGRSVRGELLLGGLLLLAVGAMTSVAPSITAWQEHQRMGLEQQATVGDVTLVLRVAPAQVGENEWAVDVTDLRAGAQAAPSRVLLRFDMQGMEMGKLQADTTQVNQERYSARGSFTSMGGRWNVEVVLRRAGFDDIDHTFQMDIVRSAFDQ